MGLINEQLEVQGLKISKAQFAVVDASIIESAGKPTRKAYEVSDDDEVKPVPCSKDREAK